jgi:hypothetical protein
MDSSILDRVMRVCKALRSCALGVPSCLHATRGNRPQPRAVQYSSMTCDSTGQRFCHITRLSSLPQQRMRHARESIHVGSSSHHTRMRAQRRTVDSRPVSRGGRQQHPPVIATGRSHLLRAQPECRITHSNNLCSLRSSPARFSTRSILLPFPPLQPPDLVAAYGYDVSSCSRKFFYTLSFSMLN